VTGNIRVEQAFMPDLRVICPTCQGKRFNAATLEVRYRGVNIREALDLTSPIGRAMFALVGVLAEVERAWIVERMLSSRSTSAGRSRRWA
jgi:excinuclease UvrABC ATPase subunit